MPVGQEKVVLAPLIVTTGVALPVAPVEYSSTLRFAQLATQTLLPGPIARLHGSSAPVVVIFVEGATLPVAVAGNDATLPVPELQPEPANIVAARAGPDGVDVLEPEHPADNREI